MYEIEKIETFTCPETCIYLSSISCNLSRSEKKEYGRKLIQYLLSRKGVNASILITKKGKPYLSNSRYKFSLSYTSSCVGVLLSTIECGLDIEQINTKNDFPKMGKYFMTSNELAQYIQNDYKTDYAYKIWTRKEAVLKANGTGFLKEPTEVDVTNDTCLVDENIIKIETLTYKNFMISYAVYK